MFYRFKGVKETSATPFSCHGTTLINCGFPPEPLTHCSGIGCAQGSVLIHSKLVTHHITNHGVVHAVFHRQPFLALCQPLLKRFALLYEFFFNL
jgi:hypothetical protein